MSTRRLLAGLLLATSAGVVAACGPRQARTPDSDPKAATLVVLLPDAGDGAVGGASVSSRGAAAAAPVDLAAARETTIVGINRPPSRVSVMAEDDVRRQFGELLSALPPAAQNFTLNFRFESDELTAESQALVPAILEAIKTRPVPEVVATGHTDTTGTSASNFELGMKRATTVRALLGDAGLDPASVEIVSHGEAALLVKTPDETYEPRNRRVEITVR
jgi:outer membrane protein OmpA-like peptidoglycan-associated protein